MATRKKYKIVLSEKYVRKSENGKEWFQFPVNISGQLVAIQTIIPLDPYIEPDTESIRKEAYDKGYENGFIAGHLKAEKSGQSFYEDGYQRGLVDMCECVDKINSMSHKEQEECFGRTYLVNILELEPSEIIEKIRQYEQEKEEQIQVGDELTDGTYTAVVTKITDYGDKPIYQAISFDGEVYEDFDDGHKTGRHFPEIAEVLQKMKES